jgi:hypothetical protein
MLAQQIAFEANNIRVLLDRITTTRTKRGRNVLLKQATLAAHRALEQLQREPLVQSTATYVYENLQRHELNPWSVLEELRLDRETIRWFIDAECDLLRASGFDRQLIDRLQEDMFDVLSGPIRNIPDTLNDEFTAMLSRMDENLVALNKQAHRSEIHRDLAAVLGILGGCGIVAVDTAAAVATTGLLSPIIAASAPVGAEIITRSVSEALEE